MLSGLTRQATAGGLGSVDAQKQAYARIYDLVQLQAASLAYVDTFMSNAPTSFFDARCYVPSGGDLF